MVAANTEGIQTIKNSNKNEHMVASSTGSLQIHKSDSDDKKPQQRKQKQKIKSDIL